LTWNLQRISTLDLPPEVDAGPDQVIPVTQGLGTLRGAARDDTVPDEELVTTWRLQDGPDGLEIDDPDALETTFTFSKAGIYLFDLQASDGTRTTIDTVTITANTAPTADAGEHRVVAAGIEVSLDGSQSDDPDADDSLTYAWRQTAGPEVTITDSALATAKFIAPDPPAELSFELTVTDPFGESASDEVVVTVNNPPVANAGQDIRVVPGSSVRLDGSASADPDEGDSLRYTWTQTGGPEVDLTGVNTAEPSFTAPEEEDTLIFRLSAVDDLGAEGADFVKVTVVTGNRAPVADAGSDRNVVVGLVVTLDASASTDPDADALSFIWDQTAGPEVEILGADTGQATFVVPEDADSLSFTLVVQDALGGLDTAAVTFTVVAEPHVRLATSMGEIVIEVLLEEAPVTSLNFLRYVDQGFYDGTIFHRVVPDFVVQGGGFLPGMEQPEGLRDPIVNEFSPDRSNLRATVAMAKLSDDPDSATSQFFFSLADNSDNLDNQNGGFTVFARVIEGMDVVDAIAEVDLVGEETPVEEVLLEEATIE
jgi:cyclophilin family peptidyl-prolyl cis-trans isomerase